jgi:hypothetical protein
MKRRILDARASLDIRCRTVRLLATFAVLYLVARLVLL